MCSTCGISFPTYLFQLEVDTPMTCRFCQGDKTVTARVAGLEAELECLKAQVAGLSGDNLTLTTEVPTTFFLDSPQVAAEHAPTGNEEFDFTVSLDSGVVAEEIETGNDGFSLVRSGAKPRKAGCIQPVALTNNFSVLPGLQETDEREIRVVGDSITRGMLHSYCNRNAKKRRRYCFPGARVKTIRDNIKYFSAGASPETAYVVHVGTNDINRKNPNRKQLLAEYRSLIQQLKHKSPNIILSAILPRLNCPYGFLDDAFKINSDLKRLCTEEKIGFIDAWHSFFNISDMYAADGLHMSSIGSTRLGRIYNDATKNFFRG
jgi:hypothetical protein